MSTDKNQLLEAALRYAARGWRVFPLKGKKPYAGSHGFKEATLYRKQIREWWTQWPTANVGIACDAKHGPIVIDVDGPTGLAYIQELGLDPTRSATTGRKTKCHLYYDSPLDDVPIGRHIRPFGKEITLDILGNGGYVVAPPSKHPDTGRLYQWTHRISPERFPEVLIERLQQGDKSHQIAAPLPEKIGEGQRDNLLTSLAGSMRRRGASESAILAALREENETRVVPPLPDADLKRIAKSIARKEPVTASEHLTDMGNARRFILRYEEQVRAIVAQRRPWLVWDSTRWTPDKTGEVERFAKHTVRGIYAEAARVTSEERRDQIIKHASKSEAAGKLRALLEIAATEPEVSATPEMLDSNPWLLNVTNGTIDLRTGEIRPHKREDLITRIANVTYNPKAKAPRWEQFMAEIMNNDKELIGFLQRAVGYALTGDVREECLFFCYGQGLNGKSTFLETLRALFGEYARQSDFSSFLSSKGEGPRNDIARLHGARLVTASEADSEKGFDGRIIKLLTSSDTITARKLYEEATEFKSQHKLFLAANHKPVVREHTKGFWRRIHLIPFTQVFDKGKRDKRLDIKLIRELPGILNWAMEGCKLWRAEGLKAPTAVKEATRSYREENDILGEFLAHACKSNPDSWTSSPNLYRAFTDWWTSTRGPRSQPVSMGWFSRMLGERPEFTQRKRGHIRGWQGIEVKLNFRAEG